LGADKDGQSDSRQNACLVVVDADLHKGLYEHFFAYLVDPTLELGDQGIGAGPTADGALSLVVDTDGYAPEQVNAIQRCQSRSPLAL
jgi:hypothetical protein